jgi:hypothetical protein
VPVQLRAIGDARVDLLATDRRGGTKAFLSVWRIRGRRSGEDGIDRFDDHHQAAAVRDPLVERVEGDPRTLGSDDGANHLAEPAAILGPGLATETRKGLLCLVGEVR